jgi:hypothetical protein
MRKGAESGWGDAAQQFVTLLCSPDLIEGEVV